MPKREATDETNWDVATGRALAFLCLHFAGLRDAQLLEQADFLLRHFGIGRRDAAAILGTTDKSLQELTRQRNRKSAPRAAIPRKTRPTR